MTDVKPSGGHYSSWLVRQRIMTVVWVKQEPFVCLFFAVEQVAGAILGGTEY